MSINILYIISLQVISVVLFSGLATEKLSIPLENIFLFSLCHIGLVIASPCTVAAGATYFLQ